MFVTEEMEFFECLTMLILLDGFYICLQPHTKDLIYHDLDLYGYGVVKLLKSMDCTN